MDGKLIWKSNATQDYIRGLDDEAKKNALIDRGYDDEMLDDMDSAIDQDSYMDQDDAEEFEREIVPMLNAQTNGHIIAVNVDDPQGELLVIDAEDLISGDICPDAVQQALHDTPEGLEMNYYDKDGHNCLTLALYAVPNDEDTETLDKIMPDLHDDFVDPDDDDPYLNPGVDLTDANNIEDMVDVNALKKFGTRLVNQGIGSLGEDLDEAKSKSPTNLADELHMIQQDYEAEGPEAFYVLPFEEFESQYPEFTKSVIKTFLKEVVGLTKSELNDLGGLVDEDTGDSYWETGELITDQDWPCLLEGAEMLANGKGIQWEKLYKKYYKSYDESLDEEKCDECDDRVDESVDAADDKDESLTEASKSDQEKVQKIVDTLKVLEKKSKYGVEGKNFMKTVIQKLSNDGQVWFDNNEKFYDNEWAAKESGARHVYGFTRSLLNKFTNQKPGILAKLFGSDFANNLEKIKEFSSSINPDEIDRVSRVVNQLYQNFETWRRPSDSDESGNSKQKEKARDNINKILLPNQKQIPRDEEWFKLLGTSFRKNILNSTVYKKSMLTDDIKKKIDYIFGMLRRNGFNESLEESKGPKVLDTREEAQKGKPVEPPYNKRPEEAKNRKLKKEELDEDFQMIQLTPNDQATNIRALIKSCWDSVDQFSMFAQQLNEFGSQMALTTVNTLINDLYIAIGSFEEELSTVDPKSTALDAIDQVQAVAQVAPQVATQMAVQPVMIEKFQLSEDLDEDQSFNEAEQSVNDKLERLVDWFAFDGYKKRGNMYYFYGGGKITDKLSTKDVEEKSFNELFKLINDNDVDESLNEGIQKFCIKYKGKGNSYITKAALDPDNNNVGGIRDVIGYKSNDTLLFNSKEEANNFVKDLMFEYNLDNSDLKVEEFFHSGGMILDSLSEDLDEKPEV